MTPCSTAPQILHALAGAPAQPSCSELVARVTAAELRVTALASLPDAIRGARMERSAATAFLASRDDSEPAYIAAHGIQRGEHRRIYDSPDPLAKVTDV